ncbi:unnamed protein product [Chilo suppressalis]|uniref:Cytochrome c oxidase polypeptide VIIc n=1 Tax=Chilo suppressalis TaxID=168631 RepID=A0ABN8B713_CHISP|nr:hypothetical protein evm_013779 [Chilo suppressalis]CAH0401715.1 unnamed protein product [Chilo suppressalis]
MLVKICSTNILRRALPSAIMPSRKFAQVGLVMSTPPRYPCSTMEKIIHSMFMMFIWLAPVGYGMTQLKVWRRQYLE